MATTSIDELNQRFSLGRYLNFREGQNGFIYAKINNDSASAQIYLYGAQITSFIPHGHEPVIFLSEKSNFSIGKALRGGIPISWPWFADHPSDRSKPAHGFVRTSLWEVIDTNHLSTDETEITLRLNESQATRDLWDHCFTLELDIVIGQEMILRLRMINSDNDSFTATSAFHSYYSVGHINEINILGLEDINYIDKVDRFSEKRQIGSVAITDETDRIYLNTENECVIEDHLLHRRIRIRKSGSESTVVWNPWINKARLMHDLKDEDYLRFVCLETTNAGPDTITLAPNQEHLLTMNVTVDEN